MIFRYAQNQNTQSTIIATIGASEYHIGQIGGSTIQVGGAFNRPANTTIYAANDLVTSGTALELKNIARVAGGSGYLTGFKISTNAVIATRFRIHIGKTSDFFTILVDNDLNNQAFSDINNNNYLGYIDLSATMSGANTTTSFINDNAQRFAFKAADADVNGALFFVLETLDVFTPTSGQTIKLTVTAEQN